MPRASRPRSHRRHGDGNLRQARGRPGVWELRVTDRAESKRQDKQVVRYRMFRGTEADAQTELKAFAVEVARGQVAVRSAETFGDVLDEWLKLRKSEGWSPTTLSRDGYSVETLRAHLGDRRVDSLSVQAFNDLKATLAPTHAPASIVKVLQAARSSLDMAVAHGIIRANPVASVKPPKVLKPDTDAPTVAELQKLIIAGMESNLTMTTMLIVGARTGARRGELCALRWSDVVLEGKSPHIRVRRTLVLTGDSVEERHTKTGKQRKVRIGPATVDALRLLMATQKGECEDRELVWCRKGHDGEVDDFVFSPEPDCSAPYRPDSATGWIAKLAKRAGIKTNWYAATRHFSASEMIAGGMDPVTAAARLGHSPKMLLDRYGHLREGRDEAAALLLEDVLA
jgi:integrase